MFLGSSFFDNSLALQLDWNGIDNHRKDHQKAVYDRKANRNTLEHYFLGL